MSEYPVKQYVLTVLVPWSTTVTDEFGIAVARLTTATSPGVTIEDAISEVVENPDDTFYLHDYKVIVGRVRYIEPTDEDREYAEGLKGRGITASTITWPSF